jgi:hypothetical protein
MSNGFQSCNSVLFNVFWLVTIISATEVLADIMF